MKKGILQMLALVGAAGIVVYSFRNKLFKKPTTQKSETETPTSPITEPVVGVLTPDENRAIDEYIATNWGIGRMAVTGDRIETQFGCYMWVASLFPQPNVAAGNWVRTECIKNQLPIDKPTIQIADRLELKVIEVAFAEQYKGQMFPKAGDKVTTQLGCYRYQEVDRSLLKDRVQKKQKTKPNPHKWVREVC